MISTKKLLYKVIQKIGTIEPPIGAVEMYAGSTAPTGWLLCDGSAVSRTTYSALFAIIGTTYGTGDGSTTFNLPDLKGKVAVGVDTGYALGSTGGSADAIVVAHSHSVNAVSISSSGAHAHSVYYRSDNTATGNGDRLGTSNTHSGTRDSVPSGGAHTHSVPSHNTNSTGSTGTGANMQPYVAMNYMIYAG